MISIFSFFLFGGGRVMYALVNGRCDLLFIVFSKFHYMYFFLYACVFVNTLKCVFVSSFLYILIQYFFLSF